MSRSILHVDMDAFFASVEIRDRPELAGRPVIVGGQAAQRGVVAAASYAARRYGIHSAMPTATALRLCPQAVLLPPRHGHYVQVSRQINAIFARYTPQIEPLSLDEAFLDVSASLRLFGAAGQIARDIKRVIACELGLVASVGVAPNKFVAKIASDLHKPDGFVAVEAAQVLDFLAPLPVSRLWGVGKVGQRRFERLGIETLGQLRGYPLPVLRQHFGGLAEALWQQAHGIDERPVLSEREAKSVSQETTFAHDIADGAVLRAWLQDLSAQVAWRLRHHGLRGRTVQIKVRLADFSTLTRAQTLPEPSDISTEIRDTALQLFDRRLPRPLPPVRLLGVGVSNFQAQAAEQGDLFEQAGRERQSRLDAVMDAVAARYGRHSLRRGGWTTLSD